MPKVLIVDDSLSARRALERVLSRRFEVVAAQSGEEALERSAVTLPDLVIADVIMPGIGGFELCRRLREQYPNLPVVLISGVGDAQIEQQAQAVGAAAVLPKPFSPEALSAALGAVANASAPVQTTTEPAQADVPAADAQGAEVERAEPEPAEPKPNSQAADAAPDLIASLTKFLEKPEVMSATLSDRQGISVVHVGEHPTDAQALASYSRFSLAASDVLGVHFGAEYTSGVMLEFPGTAFYVGRVDAQHVLSLRLADAGALDAVREFFRAALPELAAGLGE